jgi:hypothetical protein
MEMIVQRRGGTISLKSIDRAVKNMQAGSDRAAAELAIARLTQELQRLVVVEGTLSAELSAELIDRQKVHRSYGRLVRVGAVVLFASFLILAWVIDAGTIWTRHGSWLRPTVWLGCVLAGFAVALLMVESARALDAGVAVKKTEHRWAVQHAVAGKEDELRDIREQIEGVRLQLAENRAALDSGPQARSRTSAS